MLTAGPCRPVGRCGGTRPFTCYMGDVSWALPAAALPATSRNAASSNSSNPADNPIANVTLTITVTASAAVAQPCRLCGGFEQLPYQVLQATVRLTAVLVPVGLKQPQPGQPLQEQALSGAATAVGSATAGAGGGGGGGGSVGAGGGAAFGALEARLSTSSAWPVAFVLPLPPAASAAPVAPVAPVASAPALVVLFVRRPRGVAKVGRARFSWHALEMTGVHSPARCDACTFLCKVRPPSCTRYLCKGTSASPLSPSPLPHLPLQGASPTSPLSRYLHAASSSPLPSRLQGPSHPALAPARRHSLLSQYPVSPHLFLSRLKNKVRPPRPYPGSSPFPPPSLPRVSPPLPLFSFSFSLHIAAMRALGGTKHVGSPYPAIPPPPCPPTPPSPSASPPASPSVSPSSPPRQPPIRSWTRSQASPVRGGGSQRAGSWTVPTASQSPRSGERRGSLAPAPPAPVNPRTSSSPSPPLTPLPVRSQLDALPSFPCPRGWFTARGLTDGRHRFTVNPSLSSPPCRPPPLTAGRPPQLPLSPGVLDALPSFPCPRGWFTAAGLTDGPNRFTVTALRGAPGVTGTRLQAATADVGMGGEWGGGVEGGGGGGGGGRGGAQVEAQAQATYEWVADAASPVPTLTVDPPQAREGSVQISIAFDKPCLGLQCNSTETSPSEMHFSAPSFPFPLASNPVVPIPSKAASPVPTLTVDPPQAREGSAQISIAFDKPCPGLQCNSTEISPSEMHFSAPSFPFPLASNHVVPIKSGQSGANANSGPATGKGGVGAGITTGQSQVQASPQGIVSIDPSSFLACADSSGRAWMAGFGSYAVIRIDRAPLEATLTCDTPLAVVKFFTQLRATPRVSQSPVTCRVLFSKPVSSFPSSSLAIANATASNPQSVSDLEYQFQPVSSFSSASLAVANATTSDPQHVTDLEYQFQVGGFLFVSIPFFLEFKWNLLMGFTVWPTGKGSVVVDIRHENVTDVAGNICQPTQPFFFFFFFDTTPPTVQLSGSETSATTDWVYPILVAFSPSLLPLYHAALSPHFSLSRFRFATMSALQPPDTTRPTVQLSASESSATTNWVYPILVAFSEPVLGFNSSSLQLSNGVITW
ncbi:unnamed protein product [Closterium sp. NIES-65]|nr:unnamed protein product [Closterium sp. NIES-65]